ncbi:hypothetical protein ABIB15_003054 [Marisediminicola sp. UYEF4]|uniref:cupin domain-containing protein n=1 Tax=Marisediminicola sp. UYEF4 TaxID=1756384 RepID=UPI003392B8F2
MITDDPVETNPLHYRIVFENEFVRVLDYSDRPGTTTTPHDHPNSVMITLSDFRRRLASGDQEREVALTAGQAMWLPAQRHFGENIGDTPTHTIFVELKGAAAGESSGATLGPAAASS